MLTPLGLFRSKAAHDKTPMVPCHLRTSRQLVRNHFRYRIEIALDVGSNTAIFLLLATLMGSFFNIPITPEATVISSAVRPSRSPLWVISGRRALVETTSALPPKADVNPPPTDVR
jgi:hypothetical protein